MKIGMILDQVFPPDPRVENEAITLIDSGHEVFLFCLTYGNEKFSENIDGIQVKRFKSNKLEFKLSALSCDFPLYNRMMKSKIHNFINTYKPDALHIHDIRIAEVVFQINKKNKLPVILDLHENRPEIMKYYPHLNKFPGSFLISPNRWKVKEEQFVKQADKVIVVTQQSANEIIERVKINSQKIHIVPNTVRKSFYEKKIFKKSISNCYKDKFVVLYIGDTHLRRGLLTAINATNKLSKKIKNFKLVIVGVNSTDSILKDRVSQLKINEFVDFVGWKNPSFFSSYIINSDICISPLYRNQHHDTTYPNKIFQYMSFGKPVIVSNAIAQKEIIERANAGLVHEEKNENDFANKVLELYHNKEKSQQLGTHGKKFIENEFSWEITSQDLIKLYNEL